MRQHLAVAVLALLAGCSLQGVGEGTTTSGGGQTSGSMRGGSSSGGTTSSASTLGSTSRASSSVAGSSSGGSTSSSTAACSQDSCPSCQIPYSCQDDSCVDGTWTCGCGCLDAGTGCGNITCPTGCNITPDCQACIPQSPTAGVGTSCVSDSDCCTGTCVSGACTPLGGSSSSSSGGSSGSSSSSSGSSSGGGTSGSTSSGSGGLSVTLTSVGVHPAALAALSALGLTPPSLATGYSVLLQAVTLKAGAPFLSTVGSVPLTAANASGPITFSNISVAGGVASLGLQSSIVPTGGPGTPSFPACSQLVSGGSAFADSFVSAASQVYFGTPTANVTSGAAYALPASYVALLDCAAGLVPGGGSDLYSGGFGLLYASQSAVGAGAPLAGVTFGNGAGGILYFPAGYAAGTATANGPSSANGVATITGITGLATVTASDAAAGTFKSRDLGTAAGSAYLVFYAPGT